MKLYHILDAYIDFWIVRRRQLTIEGVSEEDITSVKSMVGYVGGDLARRVVDDSERYNR